MPALKPPEKGAPEKGTLWKRREERWSRRPPTTPQAVEKLCGQPDESPGRGSVLENWVERIEDGFCFRKEQSQLRVPNVDLLVDILDSRKRVGEPESGF